VKTPNLSVSRTARKLRLRVPSALRAPAAGYLKGWSADFRKPQRPLGFEVARKHGLYRFRKSRLARRPSGRARTATRGRFGCV